MEYLIDFITYTIDFIVHVDVHLQELVSSYGIWIYAILFLIVFCETGLVVTPFLPGDSLLFVAGAISALPSNEMNVHLLVPLIIFAAILGDAINYLIGKYFGKRLFQNRDSKIFKQHYLDKTHQFYEKHGGKTIILARFMPIIRTFAPFVAGMGKMNYSHFFFFNVVGAVVWVVLFTYIGFWFGNEPFIQKNIKWFILVIIIVSILPILFEYLRSRSNEKSKIY